MPRSYHGMLETCCSVLARPLRPNPLKWMGTESVDLMCGMCCNGLSRHRFGTGFAMLKSLPCQSYGVAAPDLEHVQGRYREGTLETNVDAFLDTNK